MNAQQELPLPRIRVRIVEEKESEGEPTPWFPLAQYRPAYDGEYDLRVRAPELGGEASKRELVVPLRLLYHVDADTWRFPSVNSKEVYYWTPSTQMPDCEWRGRTTPAPDAWAPPPAPPARKRIRLL